MTGTYSAVTVHVHFAQRSLQCGHTLDSTSNHIIIFRGSVDVPLCVYLECIVVQCILGYPNLDYLDHRLSERAKGLITSLITCLHMHNLPTFVGVAIFALCALRGAVDRSRLRVLPRLYMTKSKLKRKAISKINDKVSIVKQLKSSSVAIIAESYGL